MIGCDGALQVRESMMLAEYEAAVAIAPHDAALRNDYGAMLLMLGRPAQARAQFEAGLESAPIYAYLHYNAALAAEQVGDQSAALEHYRDIVTRASRRLVVQRTAADKRIAALAAHQPAAAKAATAHMP